MPSTATAPLGATCSSERHYDDARLLDALPIGVYLCDAEGRLLRWNPAAEALWGRRPVAGDAAEQFCGSFRLFDLSGAPILRTECAMAVALATGRSFRDERVVIERPDGSRLTAEATIDLLRDDDGQVVGAVNTFREARRLAEAERPGGDLDGRAQDDLALQRLASIVESSDDAILSKDVNGVITSWNRGAERLFGYSEAEAVGRPVTMLIPEDRQDEEPHILGRIRRGERIDHYETVRRRKDGQLVDISLSVSPIADSSGRIVGASKIARDISDRRRADEQRELLLREMEHRVKNLFALAGGLVSLSARDAETVAELEADLKERFRALANAHDLALPGAARHRFGRGATLGALIASIFEPYLDEGDERLTVIGGEIGLRGGAVPNFALLLHEFATNAVKYGALAFPEGRLRIECRETEGRFEMVWREDGVEGGAVKPTEEGFGSRLARAMIGGALNGAFHREFDGQGMVMRLLIPLERLVETD